jgi:hypothetical protein
MAPIRRNRNGPAQLPHPVRLQAKMADPVTSPNGGPFTLILENQSRAVSSHTDVRVHKKIKRLHGTHHKLDFAEESGGAVMLGKPVLQHASDEKSSLQNQQMEDKHRDSEPDRNNMSPAGKVRVLIKTVELTHRILIMRNCMSLELMQFLSSGKEKKKNVMSKVIRSIYAQHPTYFLAYSVGRFFVELQNGVHEDLYQAVMQFLSTQMSSPKVHCRNAYRGTPHGNPHGQNRSFIS